MTKDIADLRQDYQLGELLRADLHNDPIAQFNDWFETAKTASREANAMTLSTVLNQRPQSRVVLLKGIDAGGFVFYTNKLSQKGQAIEQSPFAALNFWWENLERQIRIEGQVEHVEDSTATAYFLSRPRTSQLGAWASRQSEVLADDDMLQRQFDELSEQYPEDVPKPDHWGGYRVIPQSIEFWQGRSSRLHDRFRYTRDGSDWTIDRLSP